MKGDPAVLPHPGSLTRRIGPNGPQLTPSRAERSFLCCEPLVGERTKEHFVPRCFYEGGRLPDEPGLCLPAHRASASVWTLVTSMCADMVNAKKREFRVRDDNPCRDVRPTDRGPRKAKQYLYPSEFLRFVSCERVPLRWRRAVALAIYTYTRDAELRVLRWTDIDHGIVDITRRSTGGSPAR